MKIYSDTVFYNNVGELFAIAFANGRHHIVEIEEPVYGEFKETVIFSGSLSDCQQAIKDGITFVEPW